MTREARAIKQHFIQVALLFLMLGLLLKILSMPLEAVHWDSNYYLNTGSNFVERGELTPYMWRLGVDTTIISGSGSGYGVLLLTYWFQFFGLSLYSGYILMYSFGLLSLVVLYFLARDWWQNQYSPIIAVVFTALTGPFISQYYIRMDAPAVLSYLLILWLHLYAVRTKRNWLHFAVGVALIVAAEVHIQVLMYIGAISLYYLLRHIHKMREQRRLFIITPSVYYFTGALLAGIVYLLIHVAPDPQAYFVIARECLDCEQAGLLKELKRYLLFVYEYNAEMCIFVIALAVTYMRRTDADRHYLILVIGYILTQAIISPPIHTIYLSHILPLIGLGVGNIFISTNEGQSALTYRQLTIGAFVATYLFITQFTALFISSARPTVRPESIAYIREYVSKNTVVMGLPSLYHQLLEYNKFLSYNSGERYGLLLRGEDYPTFWEREQPQVFVGTALADDHDWWAYMHNHNFQQVRNEVWIAGDLLDSITMDYAAPEMTFTASQTTLSFGECTVLEWSVLNADAVKLNDQSVESAATNEVCPFKTTEYVLAAYWRGGIQTEIITIQIE